MLLEVENLRVWFEADGVVARAVNGLSFSLSKGESLAIVGESGCGKSVTALSLLRLLKEDGLSPVFRESVIRFRGKNIMELGEGELEKIRGNAISMIFQEPMTSLNPVYTIGSQLVEPLMQHQGMGREAAWERGIEILGSMGIPSAGQVMGNYPHQLSGGMRQRVMIGIALACRPEILIADEPTTALDVTIQAQILNLIREMRDGLGTSLILITHDLGIVSELADRVIVMYGGRMMEEGTAADILENPLHPYTRGLLKSRPSGGVPGVPLYTIPGMVEPATAHIAGCRFSMRCVHANSFCRENVPELTITGDGKRRLFCHMFSDAGKNLEFRQEAPPKIINIPGDVEKKDYGISGLPLLRIDRLQVWFPVYRGWLRKVSGYIKAVDGCSFDIMPGSTVGLVGESGCGKTTLGQALVRLVDASGGRIMFRDEPVLEKKGADLKRLRRHIQMVFQDPFSSLSPSLLIRDIVGEGLHVHDIENDREKRNGLVARVLEEVGLDRTAGGRYPHQFSGGQRQRIGIARALVLNPEIVVLDEATSALDVSVQAQILNLLKELQARRGLAYLFISHDLGVIEYLADFVAVMYQGRIVEAGTKEEIFSNPRHPYTISLLSAVPKIGKKNTKQIILSETTSDTPATGCRFQPRCPDYDKNRTKECETSYPSQIFLSPTHRVSCWQQEGR